MHIVTQWHKLLNDVTFEETRSQQQSKFERLYNKFQSKKEVTDTDTDTNRWVMNLSDRQISDDE